MISVSKFIVLILFCISLYSCEQKTGTITEAFKNVVLADVVGDKQLETIIRYENDGNTMISIEVDHKREQVITLFPLINAKYKTVSPAIENVYIEPNFIQTKDKGLRILVRNTDLYPDCYFIDVQHINKKWNIRDVGVINTTDSVYIKKTRINLPVDVVMGKGKAINIRGLAQENINFSE